MFASPTSPISLHTSVSNNGNTIKRGFTLFIRFVLLNISITFTEAWNISNPISVKPLWPCKNKSRHPLIRYQLFVYTTNCSQLMESFAVVIYSSWLSAGRRDSPDDHFIMFFGGWGRVFFSLSFLCFLFSLGIPTAVDTDASPKCCHSGAGPPDRYKITTWSYQCHVSQQQESNYALYTSPYRGYLWNTLRW